MLASVFGDHENFHVRAAVRETLQHPVVDELLLIRSEKIERIEPRDFLRRILRDRLEIFVPAQNHPARIVEVENARHRVDQRVGEFLFPHHARLCAAALRDVARDHEDARRFAIGAEDHAADRLDLHLPSIARHESVFRPLADAGPHGFRKDCFDSLAIVRVNVGERIRAVELARRGEDALVGRAVVEPAAFEIEHGDHVRDVIRDHPEHLLARLERRVRELLVGHVAQHHHAARHLVIFVANRRRIVGDGALRPVAAEQAHRPVRNHLPAHAQRRQRRIFERLARRNFHHPQHLRGVASARLGFGPARHFFGRGIEESDAPCGIRAHHAIADAAQHRGQRTLALRGARPFMAQAPRAPEQQGGERQYRGGDDGERQRVARDRDQLLFHQVKRERAHRRERHEQRVGQDREAGGAAVNVASGFHRARHLSQIARSAQATKAPAGCLRAGGEVFGIACETTARVPSPQPPGTRGALRLHRCSADSSAES